MRSTFVLAFVALGLATFAAGGLPTGARATDCVRHTDVVVYNTDTARIVGELAKYAAPCTDYYLTITPRGDHGPRPAPLAAIRAAGPQFHAMPEVRLNDWQNDVKNLYNGDWYAAGVAFRAMMTVSGFNAGDTWAVNEVGEPSNTTMAADVVKGNDEARQHLVDFVHGLHDGPSGTADPGLVFAASPLQVTTDLAQYKQDLSSWYADSAFWNGLSRYVKFWGQETYADARNWAVPGSTLEHRAVYLNDYFLHGSRLAAAGGAGTDAASAFFANAYTPIGNAAYRWPAPETTGPIGFGYTDIGLTGMENFVSSEVYSLRTSSHDRFGFAVVPHNNTVADTVMVSDRLGAAIRDSGADPLGACGTGAESWCDTSIDGAWFNGAWDVTPPLILTHVTGTLGTNGWYTSDVNVTWEVNDPESPDFLVTSGCEPTLIDVDTTGTTLTCSATSGGGAASQSLTIRRDATPPTATCTPTPSALWPPNGKLVQVDVAVSVDDATSGPPGFELVGAVTNVGDPSADIAGFDVGTPDGSGFLRAARAGDGPEREYTLTYKAHDQAGNTAECVATVVVPHDQGS